MDGMKNYFHFVFFSSFINLASFMYGEEGTSLNRSELVEKAILVLPRFTEQGTLVVNGEGQDRAMYLIRFDKEK